MAFFLAIRFLSVSPVAVTPVVNPFPTHKSAETIRSSMERAKLGSIESNRRSQSSRRIKLIGKP